MILAASFQFAAHDDSPSFPFHGRRQSPWTSLGKCGAVDLLIVVVELFLEVSYVSLANVCHDALGRLSSEVIFLILRLDPVSALGNVQLTIV